MELAAVAASRVAKAVAELVAAVAWAEEGRMAVALGSTEAVAARAAGMVVAMVAMDGWVTAEVADPTVNLMEVVVAEDRATLAVEVGVASARVGLVGRKEGTAVTVRA